MEKWKLKLYGLILLQIIYLIIFILIQEPERNVTTNFDYINYTLWLIPWFVIWLYTAFYVVSISIGNVENSTKD